MPQAVRPKRAATSESVRKPASRKPARPLTGSNRVTDDALLKAPGLQTVRVDLLRSGIFFYREFSATSTRAHPGLPILRGGRVPESGTDSEELANDDESLQSTVKARDIYQRSLASPA